MFTFSTQESTGVPTGAYNAKFERIEPVPPNAEKDFGPGFKFTFSVLSGEHAGRKASRIVGGSRPTPKNALGRMLMAFKGSPLSDGEGFDPAHFVGKPYLVVVGQTQSGGTRVETVAPPMA